MRKLLDRWIARRAFNALRAFADNTDGKVYAYHKTTIVEMLDILREHIERK